LAVSTPLFSQAEFAERTRQVTTRLADAGITFALFDEIEAMTWLTGYGNSENRWRCVGVGPDASPFFLIRALDAEPCRQRNWIEDVPVFRDWEDPMAVLREALVERGLDRARIGLDFNSYGMSLARFAAMRAALPDVEWVDIGPLVWELRLRKSPAEIALVRRSAAIADAALQVAAEACVPGASQRDAARAASGMFLSMGADPGPVGPISSARGWDFLHGHLSGDALVAGDVVHIEVTPRISGYSARVMRCVSVGPPAADLAKAADTLAHLQRRQIAAMRPGAEAAGIDAILREGMLQAKLRDSYDNITGYTLGFYAAAGPRTSDFTRIFTPESRRVRQRNGAGDRDRRRVPDPSFAFPFRCIVRSSP
jgi:Xaa-Pro aminopeptidase